MQRKTWYYEKWGGRQASFYQMWSVKHRTSTFTSVVRQFFIDVTKTPKYIYNEYVFSFSGSFCIVQRHLKMTTKPRPFTLFCRMICWTISFLEAQESHRLAKLSTNHKGGLAVMWILIGLKFGKPVLQCTWKTYSLVDYSAKHCKQPRL